MRFANLICLAASVSGYTFLPTVSRVPPAATEHIPNGDCSQFTGCHECVLAGCSPVTTGDRDFHTCAIPGSTHGQMRPEQRPSYEALFSRARKCKDEKKICRLAGSEGSAPHLENADMGFKKVTKGSVDDIIIPTNYFCLV